MAVVESTPEPAAVAGTRPEPLAPTDERSANPVAVITGGASGIGRALAERLAGRGMAIVVVDLNGAAAAHLAQQLRDGGSVAESAAIDVTDAAAINQLVQDIFKTYGRIDFLFNNAGVGWGGDFHEMSTAEIERMIDINLRAVLLTASAVYPIMIRQGSGHIINTASIDGLIPKPKLALYSATKHAVVGFSHALSVEAQAHGVFVTVVCPGVVETNIRETSAAILRGSNDGGDRLPANRVMSAEHCAKLILRGVDRRDETIVLAFFKPLWWFYRTVPGVFRGLARPLYLAKAGRLPDSSLGRFYVGTFRRVMRFLRTGRWR